jgi:hypothetical protein
MRCTYYFKDSVDTLLGDKLSKEDYDNFIQDVIIINKDYGFSLYLIGSYIDFLVSNNNKYTDINFIITNEKLLDLDELSVFFKKFHDLVKKYNFIYDISYIMDVSEDDINFNPKSLNLFNIKESRIISQYKSRKIDNKIVYSLGVKYQPKLLEHTDLYQSIIKANNVSEKFIDKKQKNVFFHKPIKII